VSVYSSSRISGKARTYTGVAATTIVKTRPWLQKWQWSKPKVAYHTLYYTFSKCCKCHHIWPKSRKQSDPFLVLVTKLNGTILTHWVDGIIHNFKSLPYLEACQFFTRSQSKVPTMDSALHGRQEVLTGSKRKRMKGQNLFCAYYYILPWSSLPVYYHDAFCPHPRG